MNKKKANKLVDTFLVIIILAIAVILRIFYAMYLGANLQVENDITNIAMIQSQTSMNNTYFGYEAFYISILSLVFALFGNKITVAILFQIILQCIGIFLIYLSMRKIIGRVGGFVTIGILAVIPFVTEVSGNHLLFVIVSIFLLIAATLYSYISDTSNTIEMKCVITFILSFVMILMISADVYGFIFSGIVTIGVIFLSTNLMEKSIREKICLFTVSLIGNVLGVVLYGLFFTILEKVSFLSVVKDYWQQYSSLIKWNTDPFERLLLDDSKYFIYPFLAIVCLAVVFSYLLKEWKNNTFLFLLLLASLLFSLWFNGNLVYGYFMVAIGVCCFANSIQRLVRVREERILLEDERLVTTDDITNDSYLESDVIATEASGKTEPKNEANSIKTIIDRSNNFATKEIINLQPPKSKIQYLENPLPVPKRHIKKEMDYAMEPTKDLMKFDIDQVNEHDDYDIE